MTAGAAVTHRIDHERSAVEVTADIPVGRSALPGGRDGLVDDVERASGWSARAGPRSPGGSTAGRTHALVTVGERHMASFDRHGHT